MVDIAALLQRCTFPRADTRVDCAVSGGADSLALLVLAVEAGCAVTAWHIDHGLRPGSADEAERVAAVAAALGCSFRSVTVAVEPGPNLEARARAARYDALPEGVLTGHTADDQAETVLLHMMRGAGPSGLAGMRREPRRPILALRRAETEAVCASRDIAPFVDPTNRDPAFRRNRVRHELLPLLSDIAERDVVPLLVRQADHQRAIEALLDDLADGVDPTDVHELRRLDPLVADVVVRSWIRRETDSAYAIDRAALDRVRAVVQGAVAAAEVAGGWRVQRSAGRLSIVAARPHSSTPSSELSS